MANLQRQVRKPRFVIGNTGKFGRLQPFFHSNVFAGETQKEVKAQLNFMSEPINVAQSGATIDVWFYYVPFSLIWSNFQNWVMGDSGETLAEGSVTNARTLWGKTTSTDELSLYAKQDHALGEAYKLVINHYFKEDNEQLTSVPSTAEALPLVDHSAEFMTNEEWAVEEETIDVSSGTLSLTELERKKANLRYERRVEAMDGKYINWLKNQGVNANETLAEVPEFIGHYRRYIKPARTVDQSNGFTVQHYGHECKIKLSKRRYFQEAGVVIGVYSVRPKVHINSGFDLSGSIFASSQAFPQTGQLAEHKLILGGSATMDGYRELDASGTTNHGEAAATVDHYLWKGFHQAYNTDADYIAVNSSTDPVAARYPTSTWDSMLVTSQEVHYAVDGVVNHNLVTPLNKLLLK